MYLSHFGLDEPPFRITPHTDFFFGGANRGATLDALVYAISHDEGIVKVSGEVGSGKTMLCRVLMERLPGSVETIYLANPSLARDEILIAIADELKLDLGSERSTRVLRALQDHLISLYAQGRRVVVLIDEAHAMPRETLEEIRLLSNLEANRHKLLQIVLFGQPELDQQLNTADMRQLKERITHSFRLSPMGQADIEKYIEFRLRAAGYRGPNPFSSAAIRRIVQASEGLTRRINILADKSLLAAFAANTHAITDREVKRAVDDSEFYRPATRRPLAALAAGGIFVGLIAGFAVALLIVPMASSAPELKPGSPANLVPAPTVVAKMPVQPAAEAFAARTAVTQTLTPQTVIMPSASNGAATEATRQTQQPASTADRNDPIETETMSRKGLPTPAKGKLVQERFLATQDWLASAPDRHHAIQLLTVKETELGKMEVFLAKASRVVPEADLHVYSVKIDGAQHYRAAYGDFPSTGPAAEAIKELPPLFKALNPYQRSIERMRSQNRQ